MTTEIQQYKYCTVLKDKSAVITLVERLSKAIIALKTNGRKASDIEASINQWFNFTKLQFNLL